MGSEQRGDFEVGIVGGGPAGLSAALLLGRCRRRVVLFDDERYRNEASHAVHGFLTRDGAQPDELRRLGRGEVAHYPSVERREVSVVDVVRDGTWFVLSGADGSVTRCRMLLLATGIVDRVPDIEGAKELLGQRVFHCPYCDGWEHRDQGLAAIGMPNDGGALYAIELQQWTRDVVFCPGGPARLSTEVAERLARRQLAVEERRILRLEADGEGMLIHFAEGSPLRRDALFYCFGFQQRSNLALRLGCRLDERGGIEVDHMVVSDVPGLYIAGDASRDVLQSIVAAGEGAAAAVLINSALTALD